MNNLCHRNLQMNAKLLELLHASEEMCNFEAKLSEPANLVNYQLHTGLEKKRLPEVSRGRFIASLFMIIKLQITQL